MKRELQACQQRLRSCQRQLDESRSAKQQAEDLAESKHRSLSIRLFRSLKEAKKYDEAEKHFHEMIKKNDNAEKLDPVTVADRDPPQSHDSMILELKLSFAGMLIEQQRFQDAEPISRAVWDQMKQCPDPLSEVSKESHRQLCAVLCAVKKYKEAEYMHRSMYQREMLRETLDAWALENGDELCQRLREQDQLKKAKEMQDEVWKERLKLDGPRDGFAIRSGLRLVRFLEELVEKPARQEGSTAEGRLDASQKKAFGHEIEVVLQKIWDERRYPELNIDVLDAGHKLGEFLFQDSKSPEAKAVFEPVWEAKKELLTETNKSTMSTGSKLAEAYYLLEDWPNAERVYKSIIPHKAHRHGFTTQEIDNARWSLGKALSKQEKNKDREAEIVLSELFHRWNASSPNTNRTLQCGQMLAQSLSTQNGKSGDALKIALRVFNGSGASAERSETYLESGHLYALLLLEAEKFAEAERILKSVWENQVEGDAKQKVRLNCGHLYGQALAKGQKYLDAKRILEAVAAGQEAVLLVGADEIAKTRVLLEEVNRLEKERRRKPNSRQKSITVSRRNRL